jgi:hypothetical protein
MISVKKGTTWTQKLRIASPILASTTTIVTLITCVVISRVNEFYVGGLKWPYFSDMGRGMRHKNLVNILSEWFFYGCIL